MITIFAKANSNLSKKRKKIANFFGENILDIKTSTPGVTIFCDFHPFSAKKWAFFSKNQCNDQVFSQFT
jgi:hypothetical protein